MFSASLVWMDDLPDKLDTTVELILTRKSIEKEA